MKDPNPGMDLKEEEIEKWVGDPEHYTKGNWELDAEFDVPNDSEDDEKDD
jgi:hypothetical protein